MIEQYSSAMKAIASLKSLQIDSFTIVIRKICRWIKGFQYSIKRFYYILLNKIKLAMGRGNNQLLASATLTTQVTTHTGPRMFCGIYGHDQFVM